MKYGSRFCRPKLDPGLRRDAGGAPLKALYYDSFAGYRGIKVGEFPKPEAGGTDVLVRVDPNFSLAMHLDTDEGNTRWRADPVGDRLLEIVQRLIADGALLVIVRVIRIDFDRLL